VPIRQPLTEWMVLLVAVLAKVPVQAQVLE
jgi:hypothetical protein